MTVLEAIRKIAYSGRRFPGKELRFVLDHWEEARPYLRGIIEKATEKPEEVDEEETILIPALMLLGEKEDREFFPQLVRFVSIDSECLEMMLGDLITEDLKDVLYSLYNGDLELVKESARNTDINEYVRTDFLEVMGQLYMDGKLEEQELKDFIREGIHSGEESDIIYNTLLQLIEGNHFVDMLCEVRYMYDNDLITEFFMGGYDSAVDECYMYTDKPFCRTPIRTIERLSKWAMYDSGESEIDLGKAVQELKKMEQPARTEKIGRNDPCPCGSGKKYKNCCMKKQAAEEDEVGEMGIESRREEEKALRDYPYLGDERVEGRVYLGDNYDAQAIEIDRLLYLGLMHRPGLIWNRNLQKEEERKRAYLELAFGKFQEKVAMEDVHTLEAYDEKFSIHYRCRKWLEELLDITDENTARKIRQMIRKMK